MSGSRRVIEDAIHRPCITGEDEWIIAGEPEGEHLSFIYVDICGVAPVRLNPVDTPAFAGRDEDGPAFRDFHRREVSIIVRKDLLDTSTELDSPQAPFARSRASGRAARGACRAGLGPRRRAGRGEFIGRHRHDAASDIEGGELVSGEVVNDLDAPRSGELQQECFAVGSGE